MVVAFLVLSSGGRLIGLSQAQRDIVLELERLLPRTRTLLKQIELIERLGKQCLLMSGRISRLERAVNQTASWDETEGILGRVTAMRRDMDTLRAGLTEGIHQLRSDVAILDASVTANAKVVHALRSGFVQVHEAALEAGRRKDIATNAVLEGLVIRVKALEQSQIALSHSHRETKRKASTTLGILGKMYDWSVAVASILFLCTVVGVLIYAVRKYC